MSDSSSALSLLLKRLEGATSRLEDLALTKNKDPKLHSSSSSSHTARRERRPTESENESPIFKEIVPAFDSIVVPYVEKYLILSEAIGDVVAEQAKIIKELMLNHQRVYIGLASKTKKPKNKDQLMTMFQPSQSALEGLIKHVEANRESPLFNHLSTISSGIPAVSWVIVEPDTATCVKELLDSSQFYANRVIKAFKAGDTTHLDWANSVVDMFTKLYEYVVKYHKKGLLWNPRGKDFGDTAGGHENRPIPTKQSSTSLKETSAVNVSTESPHIETSRGSSAASSQKKPDKSPSLRSLTSSAQASEPAVVPPAKSSARSASKISKEGETILEGNKWQVQNHSHNTVTVELTQPEQSVYVYNCHFCSIQIKGKCSGVMFDNCKKSGIVVETASTSIEASNCQSCQIQILQFAPTISIEKTDGMNLYLSKGCLDVRIFSSRSSQINLQVPLTRPGEEDLSENPIPDQFLTTIKDNQVVTVPVDQPPS